eukprot:331799_1
MCCVHPCREGLCGCITLLLWWISGGAILAVLWYLIGLLCCCIPGVGSACRDIGCLCLDPLSKKVELDVCDGVCCICENICNIIWLICIGWALALFHLFCAILCLPLLLCCLQFSKIHLRLAKVSLWPVGFDLENAKPNTLL